MRKAEAMPRNKQNALDAYIGARLRLRRLLLDMSQETLAAKLSITFQQVQKYEKGVNRISAGRLFELSKALDVPVQYFYDGLDKPDRVPVDGFEEDEGVNPYLEFVSSGEGVELNNAFLKISDANMRRRLLGVIADLARLARDDFE